MLINGADNSPTLILAHGAGAAMDSDFMNALTDGLASRIRVVRFEFPYMAERRETGKKRPPDRAAKLLACFTGVLAQVRQDIGQQPVFIGGKSMGGRMATLLATEQNVTGVCVYGYPFHPPGKADKLRLGHLPSVGCPVLICQGERDPLGTREEVAHYSLPAHFEFDWLADGDHSFKPRKASGYQLADNLQQAIDRTLAFIDQYGRA